MMKQLQCCTLLLAALVMVMVQSPLSSGNSTENSSTLTSETMTTNTSETTAITSTYSSSNTIKSYRHLIEILALVLVLLLIVLTLLLIFIVVFFSYCRNKKKRKAKKRRKKSVNKLNPKAGNQMMVFRKDGSNYKATGGIQQSTNANEANTTSNLTARSDS